MRNTGPPEARPHIVGLISLTEIWRQRGHLPRKRISPHRHSLDDPDRVPASDRGEQDHIVLRIQVAVLRHILGADVIKWNLQVVERQSPPALVLSTQPSVHHGYARRFDWMSLDRRRGLDRENLHTQIRSRAL